MYHDKKGMALIGVIMAALIFSSLCGALLLMVEQDNLMAHDEETALKALYAAESGIRAVVVQLQDNSNVTFQDVEEVCKKISGRAVGDAVIDSIKPEKAGEMVKISSTGVCGRARKELNAYISMPLESKLMPILNGFTVGSFPGLTVESGGKIEGDIFCHGDVNLRADAVVTGNIYASGNVTLGSNSQVKGNITARGDIAIGEGASVTGEVQPLCDNIPEIAGFPELDGKHFLEQAGQQEGQFFGEKETPKIFSGHDLANMSGIYYVSRDVIIDPDGVEYCGDAVIFAEGKISVHSDLFPRDNDSSLALISSGDLELNNAAICGVVIAGGRLKVSGKPGGITGVAAIANMSNYCLNDFTYRKDILKGLEQYLGLEGSGIKLEIWRELYDIY